MAGQQKSRPIGPAPDLRISEWRGEDLNLRPSGYEPDELPDCSTPRRRNSLHATPGGRPRRSENGDSPAAARDTYGVCAVGGGGGGGDVRSAAAGGGAGGRAVGRHRGRVGRRRFGGQRDLTVLGLVGLEGGDQAVDVGLRRRRGPPRLGGVVRRPQVAQETVGRSLGLRLVQLGLALGRRILGHHRGALRRILDLVEQSHRLVLSSTPALRCPRATIMGRPGPDRNRRRPNAYPPADRTAETRGCVVVVVPPPIGSVIVGAGLDVAVVPAVPAGAVFEVVPVAPDVVGVVLVDFVDFLAFLAGAGLVVVVVAPEPDVELRQQSLCRRELLGHGLDGGLVAGQILRLQRRQRILVVGLGLLQVGRHLRRHRAARGARARART